MVALGEAQVMFALVLYKTKNLMFLCIFNVGVFGGGLLCEYMVYRAFALLF